MNNFGNISNGKTYTSPEQVTFFREKGSVHLNQVASDDEIDFYRPAILESVARYNTEKRKIEERDTYGKAFLQIMNLWEIDENVRQFTLNKKFGQIAAKLLGVEHVRLYHDQALFKESGGGPTPWHQDQYYWPLNTTNTITMWMPLVDIYPSMGMLTFAEGSHKDGMVKNIPISDESERFLDNYVNQKGYNVIMPDFMKAGDATFHYGYTLHKAPGNNSEKVREIMTIIYFADGAIVTHPQNEAQEKDRIRWLDGKAPGEFASSRLNPMVI